MITYSGRGDYAMVTIDMIGDGVETTVDIDLNKAPFVLNFQQSMMPRHWLVRMKDGDPPKLTSFANGRIHMEFDGAPPAPNEGTLTPRTQFDFYMFYGTRSADSIRPRHYKD
jgi:hypothetical protein